MTDAVITYTDEDTGTVFQWHGGAYIDVGSIRSDGYDLPEFVANDVINVWDDRRGESVFEYDARHSPSSGPFRYILEAFEEACREYLRQGEE